jgi:DNA-binding NarL/FixJ family response regulator
MQLLIVHDDAEVGEQLAGMVADYSEHACALVPTDAAAQLWAQQHARCDLLLAQVDGAGVDGLTLGGALSEIFPGLQVLFLPGYRTSAQRLEIARTKVFPEPIDGEQLLEAIEIAAAAKSDAPDLFHVLDVLQMCCLSKRSGAIQIVKEGHSGLVFLRDGKIVHAEGTITRGTEALMEIAGWGDIEFAYDGSIRAPETISTPWDEALVKAVTARKEEAELERIPDEAAPPSKKRGFFATLVGGSRAPSRDVS